MPIYPLSKPINCFLVTLYLDSTGVVTDYSIQNSVHCGPSSPRDSIFSMNPNSLPLPIKMSIKSNKCVVLILCCGARMFLCLPKSGSPSSFSIEVPSYFISLILSHESVFRFFKFFQFYLSIQLEPVI